MIYGALIKNKREYLNVDITELSDGILTPELLRNIETGKVRLLPESAFTIYKRLVLIALEKNLPMELHFDELLIGNFQYRTYKHSNAICQTLRNGLMNEQELKHELLQEFFEQALDANVGLLSYYILKLCGDAWEKLNRADLCCDAYFKAIDLLLETKGKHFLDKFESDLSDITKHADHLRRYDDLINYYSLYIEEKQNNASFIAPKFYFNLGIFNKMTHDYVDSMKYIDLYLEHSKSVPTSTMTDCMILKSSIYSKMGFGEQALALYSETLNLLKSTDYDLRRSMCYSNSINTVIENQMPGKDQMIADYIGDLIQLIKSDSVILEDKYNELGNIGQGYYYLNQLNESHDYFIKAFKEIRLDLNSKKELQLILESLPTFKDLDKLDFIITRLLSLDYPRMDTNTKKKYLELMRGIQDTLDSTSVDKALKTKFSIYMSTIS